MLKSGFEAEVKPDVLHQTLHTRMISSCATSARHYTYYMHR
ncbi:predicted protein [Botrytis cinerea T4]|uniref:Uncharacterized protein n=1 Tax=Botryotinia fuckeliana (strain T4) TaxID=999810 RepID=G2YE18_BOTF4|nr:predicted protein [Botrytis cinerea T4]